MSMSDIETAVPAESDIRALERFVVENDDLLELEERIGRFNIFDALRIVNREVKHSDFLAWLLDPNESHGQGGLFLRAVLMDVLRRSVPAHRPKGLSPITLDGGELRGVAVDREWHHIDLVIRCDEPRFVIAVENKIRASEHSDQLERYKRIIRKQFGDVPRQFVFLTPEGTTPSDEDWTIYDYRSLRDVLRRVVDSNRTAIGDDVLTFLDHYLRLIGSRMMNDPNITELCREIYKTHRQAIDLIVEHAASVNIGMDAVEKLISSHPHWCVTTRGKGSIGLHLAELSSNPLWNMNADGKSRPWINSYFEWWDNTVRWYFHVGPHDDLDLRRRVIEKLREHADRLKTKSTGKITNQWTTVANLKVYGWKKQEPDAEKLIASVSRLLDERAPLLRDAMALVESALSQK